MPVTTRPDALVLAALRDPGDAPTIFALCLPSRAAVLAADSAAALRTALTGCGRRRPIFGQGDQPRTADECVLLDLVASLDHGDEDLAGRLLEWLAPPPGRTSLRRHATSLARALAAGEDRQAA
jgi:hypothetical protein